MNEFHPQNPHDHFFRRTFDVLENARALLKLQLPATLYERLDPDSIQPARETFLAADEHENRLDALYTARMRNGTQVWIWMLLEHKSWVDRRIALQLLRYVLRIHEWLDRNGQPPGVIIPIVVYHGEHVWDEPTSLRDKVQAEDDLLDFVPDMRVILVDLNLLKSAFLPDFPELEARVRALQISRSPELPFEALVDLFKLLQNWGKIHSQQDTLNDIMIYLCSVFDAPNLEQLELAFHTGQLPGSEKQMPNCLEALFARGVEQGLEEGLEKGLERGREQGLERGREQGLERGLLAGRIRTLQQVLNQPTMTPRELASKSLTELQAQAAELASLLNLDPQ
ncbi:MAG: hypothetical protein RLZZ536_145 [Planctomycetota bacterium]